MSHTEAFWDQIWANDELETIDPAAFRTQSNPTHRAYLELFGDVRGKRVLDIGCGDGVVSVYLAKLGAEVMGIDISEASVQRTLALAEANGVADRVQAQKMDALEIEALDEPYPLILGKFVLHHVEPFDVFARTIHAMLEPGGRALFLENNARNALLMFARRFIAGRFGVAKYGDDEEYPLQADEIDVLERQFRRVHLHYPDFIFFRLLNAYLFRNNPKYEAWARLFERLDALVYRTLPAMRKYTYNQVVEMVR